MNLHIRCVVGGMYLAVALAHHESVLELLSALLTTLTMEQAVYCNAGPRCS